MEERRKLLESGLIGLMHTLEMPKARMMLSLALIRKHEIHEEMADWIASFHNTERTMTAQSFLLKVKELSDDNNN
jgi:hypothetical protein